MDLYVYNCETNEFNVSAEAYEGDFYYNKHGGPISFYVPRDKHDTIFRKNHTVSLPNSKHEWEVYKRIEMPGYDFDLVILTNKADISEQQASWFSDTLHLETRLKDDEGNYYNEAIEQLSENGKDFYTLGWYAAIEQCKALWKEFTE